MEFERHEFFPESKRKGGWKFKYLTVPPLLQVRPLFFWNVSLMSFNGIYGSTVLNYWSGTSNWISTCEPWSVESCILFPLKTFLSGRCCCQYPDMFIMQLDFVTLDPLFSVLFEFHYVYVICIYLKRAMLISQRRKKGLRLVSPPVNTSPDIILMKMSAGENKK